MTKKPADSEDGQEVGQGGKAAQRLRDLMLGRLPDEHSRQQEAGTSTEDSKGESAGGADQD